MQPPVSQMPSSLVSRGQLTHQATSLVQWTFQPNTVHCCVYGESNNWMTLYEGSPWQAPTWGWMTYAEMAIVVSGVRQDGINCEYLRFGNQEDNCIW